MIYSEKLWNLVLRNVNWNFDYAKRPCVSYSLKKKENSQPDFNI